MRRRVVPNTISKRFRRKLSRAKHPYILWLRCKRPAVYARWSQMLVWYFVDRITTIDPIDTPFVSMLPKTTSEMLYLDWVKDKLQ